MEQRLVIFTRYPVPHRTKTRLIPTLGAEGAAGLQCDMARHTLAVAREFAARGSVHVEVHFAGGDPKRMAGCFGGDLVYLAQGAGDLGCRMAVAFETAFRKGAERTVIVGTDCPEITPDLLREAFARLANCDVVLGPAADGGYYLIGLRRPVPQLFSGISWGGPLVFRHTLRRAEELGLRVSLLKTLSDVDRPEDLVVWQRVRKSGAGVSTARLSVVIPTLDEQDYLPRALDSLKDARGIETIVADGGSKDRTRAIAEQAGCRVLCSPPGRARQMNAGARAASGAVLLFLHADATLPAGFDCAIRALFQAGRGRAAVGGAFRLRIDAQGLTVRMIELAVSLRSRVLQMPYGDQGLFVRSDIFRRLGGFPELPVMEDFEFVRRLRCRGPIRIVDLPVTVSGRRWRRLGPWRTTWINQRVILGYYLGIAPERLARWYRVQSGGHDRGR